MQCDALQKQSIKHRRAQCREQEDKISLHLAYVLCIWTLKHHAWINRGLARTPALDFFVSTQLRAFVQIYWMKCWPKVTWSRTLGSYSISAVTNTVWWYTYARRYQIMTARRSIPSPVRRILRMQVARKISCLSRTHSHHTYVFINQSIPILNKNPKGEQQQCQED